MIDIASKLMPPRGSLFPQRKLFINSQEQQKKNSLIPQLQFADTIQIIKTDGTILCSHQTHTHLKQLKLVQFRKQIIQHSRKLMLQVYDNDIVELVLEGYYVCFKIKQGIIFYVVACASYSYSSAEQIINVMISTYDQTLLQIFGQLKLSKNLQLNQLSKLSVLNKKIKQAIRTLNLTQKSTVISSRSQKSFKTMNNNLQKIEDHSKNIKGHDTNYQQILKSSRLLKQQARKSTVYIACKKYLTYIFFIACFMIVCFLFANYY